MSEPPEALTRPNLLAKNIKLAVDTFGARVHVEWDPQAAVTPLGQLAFFIELFPANLRFVYISC